MDYNYYHYTKEMLIAERDRVSRLPANHRNLVATLDGAIELYKQLEEMHK